MKDNYTLTGRQAIVGTTQDDSDDEPTVEAPSEEADEVVEEADESIDYASLKVAELKELLKAAGKPVSGKKDELIARLME